MNEEFIRKLEKERKECEQSYYKFFCCFWETIETTKLIPNFHILKICKELQEVGERVIARKPKLYDLIINVSPAESKSTMCIQLFPAWLWLRDPRLKIISGSHTMTLSVKHSLKTKKCLKSDKFRLYWGDKIKFVKDNESLYSTTEGGERISCSVGSSIIGSHADIHIIDDPIDPEKAISKKLINKANRWFFSTLSSRKTDAEIVPLILIMQRISEGDPTSEVLNKSTRVRHIVLPATDNYEVKPAEWKKYYRGGLMNPIRKGYKVLEEEKKGKSAGDYASQYGQSPTSVEGNMIKKKDVHKISFIQLPGDIHQIPLEFDADTAYTANENNDPNGVIATKYHEGILYVFDFIKFWAEYDDAIDEIINFMESKRARYSYIAIENKASGLSMKQTLVRRQMNADDFQHMTGDKVARVNYIIKFIKSGRIKFVKGAYLENFLSDLYAFPRVQHKEAADCIVMAATRTLVEDEDNPAGQRQIISI